MKLFGAITDGKDIVNKEYVDNAIASEQEVFVAIYDSTSYADLVAAIDENKPIVVSMTNNNNNFCVTFVTYTSGDNSVMYAIYDSSGTPTLATFTVTPSNAWSVTHTNLQEALVSGTSIKTINNESLLGSGNINIQASITAITNAEIDAIIPPTQ